MRQQHLEEENKKLQDCIKALIHAYNKAFPPEEIPPDENEVPSDISEIPEK